MQFCPLSDILMHSFREFYATLRLSVYGTLKYMWDKILHKWLKVPYTLHVHEFRTPKRPKATILLLHGIGNSWKTWEKVADKMPSDVRVIAVDLLGFGSSPKPTWKIYRVKDQADSIITTLLRKGLFGPVIIVGHSLGSLVGVEMARRYPLTVRSLVLCSPPFYRPIGTGKRPHPETVLRQIYQYAIRNPGNSGKILKLVAKHKLSPDPGYVMDEAGILTFLATLDASIVNQQSLDEAVKLKQPTTIIYGKLDPLIVEKNIKYVAKQNPRVKLEPILYVGHDMNAPYRAKIVSLVRETIDSLV